VSQHGADSEKQPVHKIAQIQEGDYKNHPEKRDKNNAAVEIQKPALRIGDKGNIQAAVNQSQNNQHLQPEEDIGFGFLIPED
jgi:hypothetical protein